MATNPFARVTGVLAALAAGSWLTLAHRSGTIGDQDGAIGTGHFIHPVLLLLAGPVGLWTRHPARLEWAACSVDIAACGGVSLLIAAGQICSPWNVEGATALPRRCSRWGSSHLARSFTVLPSSAPPGAAGSWPPPSCSAHPRRSLPSPPIGERCRLPSGSSSAPAGSSAACCSGGMRAPRSGRCGRSSARAVASRRRVMWSGA